MVDAAISGCLGGEHEYTGRLDREANLLQAEVARLRARAKYLRSQETLLAEEAAAEADAARAVTALHSAAAAEGRASGWASRARALLTWALTAHNGPQSALLLRCAVMDIRWSARAAAARAAREEAESWVRAAWDRRRMVRAELAEVTAALAASRGR